MSQRKTLEINEKGKLKSCGPCVRERKWKQNKTKDEQKYESLKNELDWPLKFIGEMFMEKIGMFG